MNTLDKHLAGILFISIRYDLGLFIP